MNIFTFSLFLLQHPYVEPPDYYDNSNFCSTCDTLEFYIITFACLLLVVIMTQIKKIDKESWRNIFYLITSSIIIYLVFFKDYPTICIIIGSFAIFFTLGFLLFICFLLYILIKIIFNLIAYLIRNGSK
mgnify:CR=1 FL=1|jgi:hypothetical protein